MFRKLRTYIFSVFLIGGLLTLVSLDNPPTKPSCCCLFNGKNLKNWDLFSAQKTSPDTTIFHLEKGMLRAYGKYQGYLITKQSFNSYYKLNLEYRWNTDSITPRINNKRNSGVIYNVPTGTPYELWPRGIQFQLKDNATGDFILMKEVTIKVNGELTEPGKSVTVKRIADAEKSVGEWNELEIIYNKGQCTQRLNGVLVNEGFEASTTEGRIVLMYEGFPIDFKNITISSQQ